MGIKDAKPDRPPNDKSGHSKVKVVIDKSDDPKNGNKSEPPEKLTGR